MILFFSKNEKSSTNMQDIRVRGNEAREGRNKTPPPHLIQYEPLKQDKEKIMKIKEIIHNANADTLFEESLRLVRLQKLTDIILRNTVLPATANSSDMLHENE